MSIYIFRFSFCRYITSNSNSEQVGCVGCLLEQQMSLLSTPVTPLKHERRGIVYDVDRYAFGNTDTIFFPKLLEIGVGDVEW